MRHPRTGPEFWARARQETKRLPLKFTDMQTWKDVYYAHGRTWAGRCPPVLSNSEDWRRQLPPAQMIFGNAPERPERYEERQRDARVRKILKKYGRQSPGALGWRI